MKNIIVTLIASIAFLNESTDAHSPRIVGGYTANIQKFPYQLAILIKKNYGPNLTIFRGGAVIVSKNWAITAAHCVRYISETLFDAGFVYVRGNTSMWKNQRGGIDHKVIDTFVHPLYSDYGGHRNDFDLALMKVEKAFTGRFEKPIRVAGEKYPYATGAKVIVSGWGMINNDVEGPVDRLRAVIIKLVDHKKCQNIYKNLLESSFSQRMVCAWDTKKDACVYDSGGPLVRNNVLLGIVSWGMKCASDVFPGVYAKVSAYNSWLKQHRNAGLKFVVK